ncbi:MAG: hypothetical protein ACXQS8_09250 [Candidatus Helarchaeales archaeon]
MKSPGEVIGEMVIAGLRSKTQEEQEKDMKALFGKIAQITLPNLTEALVIFFEEMEVDGQKKKWVRYESHPTPWVRCKDCAWIGLWTDLPVKEEKHELPGTVDEAIIGTPTKKTVQIECPKCGSKRLKYKNWEHPHADIVIYGSHWDIGCLGDILVGGIGPRLAAVFKALKIMITRRVWLKPLPKIFTAMRVAKLMM